MYKNSAGKFNALYLALFNVPINDIFLDLLSVLYQECDMLSRQHLNPRANLSNATVNECNQPNDHARA